MSVYNILEDRKIITIKGEDRYNFIQGLITNDIFILDSKSSIYSCFLTPQGKYFADFFITKYQDHFLIDVPSAKKDILIAKLNMYKLRSKVEILDESCEYLIYSIYGDKVFQEGVIFLDPRNENMGFRAIVKKENKNKIESEFSKKEDYEARRINLQIPEGEKDLTSEKSFPLEFGFDKLNAISFTKGCYVGQELISRTFHRGVIRKKIFKITSNNGFSLKNTELFLYEKKIGIMLSSASDIGLCLINTEDLAEIKDTNTKIYTNIDNNIYSFI